MAEKYLVKRKACFSCPIACGRHVKMDNQEVGGPKMKQFGALAVIAELMT
jgi:aldehyde:ferredoxin oxidoreductase